MSQLSDQSMKRFNAPFKVPTPEISARTPKLTKPRSLGSSKSPRTASEAGYSPYVPKKTPDILSGLSQEQRRLEHKGGRHVAPSPIYLQLTTSQNEDIQHTVGQQIKKAFKRRLNDPGPNMGSGKPNSKKTHEKNSEKSRPTSPGGAARKPMDAQQRRQQSEVYKFKEIKIASKPPNQPRKSPINVQQSPRHQSTSKSPKFQPRSPYPPKSPCYQPKPKKTPNKSPRCLTKSPKSPHFPKSPMRTPQYSGNIQRFFGGNTPKSAGGVSVSSSILGWSPYPDQRGGAVGNASVHHALYGRGADLTSGGEMANQSVNEDAQSMYEFPVSPKSQRKLMKRKLKSKEKKRVLCQVLEIIERCSKEMAVFHQRRRELWEKTDDNNMQGFKKPRLPSNKAAQSRLLHVTASSASGGIVNREYTVLPSGSIQEEYVGFAENYR